MALVIPYGKGRETGVVTDHVDLERIDHLDVGDTGIGNRYAAQALGEINYRRVAGLQCDHIVGQIMRPAGNRVTGVVAPVQRDSRISPEPVMSRRDGSRSSLTGY